MREFWYRTLVGSCLFAAGIVIMEIIMLVGGR
jgi:hypothetical protein